MGFLTGFRFRAFLVDALMVICALSGGTILLSIGLFTQASLYFKLQTTIFGILGVALPFLTRYLNNRYLPKAMWLFIGMLAPFSMFSLLSFIGFIIMPSAFLILVACFISDDNAGENAKILETRFFYALLVFFVIFLIAIQEYEPAIQTTDWFDT